MLNAIAAWLVCVKLSFWYETEYVNQSKNRSHEKLFFSPLPKSKEDWKQWRINKIVQFIVIVLIFILFYFTLRNITEAQEIVRSNILNLK